MPELAIGLTALAVRLLHLHQLRASPLTAVLTGDGAAYEAWARAIAAGDWVGHEVFYQAPLYPYVIGVLYALAGAGAWKIRIAQALLGSIACVVLARAGSRFVGRTAGLLAGSLLALYPPAIFFDGEIQKASLSLLLMTITLACVAALRDAQPPWRCFWTGAVIGLFALNRENALILAPLVAGWLVWRSAPPRRTRLLAPAALVAGTLAVLAPVALRNRALGGELLPTTSQLGTNFYIGNHAGADGRYHPLVAGRGSARYEAQDARRLAEQALGHPLSPGDVSRYWLRRGLAFAGRQPGAWLALLARKVEMTWNSAEIVDTISLEAAADDSSVLRALKAFDFGVLLALAAAGILLTRRGWRDFDVLFLVLAVWSASIALFFVFARYRLPLAPVLAILAGAALQRMWTLSRGRQWMPVAAAATVALIAGLVAHRRLDVRDPRATTYASLGVALAESGRPAEGTGLLRRAVELSPQFAEAYLALGTVQTETGDNPAAEASFRRAADLDPSLAEAWNNLGALAGQRGDRAAALDLLRRAVAADPAYAPARANLTRGLAEAGDVDAAREEARRWAQLAPDDAEARYWLTRLSGSAGMAPPSSRPPS